MANIVQESIYYMVPFPFDFLNFLCKLFAILSSFGGVVGIRVN